MELFGKARKRSCLRQWREPGTIGEQALASLIFLLRVQEQPLADNQVSEAISLQQANLVKLKVGY